MNEIYLVFVSSRFNSIVGQKSKAISGPMPLMFGNRVVSRMVKLPDDESLVLIAAATTYLLDES